MDPNQIYLRYKVEHYATVVKVNDKSIIWQICFLVMNCSLLICFVSDNAYKWGGWVDV